ncbi:Focadhesin [Bagarius yarrelli]|uniref:Focadhesin n=1 Tax=Bagarius yarrelli TaxID=175774 RepID=A0A556TVF4_BAGYA|nr:Focadhesin [Bagarius yarrelli]
MRSPPLRALNGRHSVSDSGGRRAQSHRAGLSLITRYRAVRSLVTAVLKEKGHNDKISEFSTQSPALAALWEQCSSESVVVRSACCDALVLLVEQGHADLRYVLNSILNLLPSARNVQGLIKVVGKLLQIQASQRDKSMSFSCPYSIRSCPHPYITVLENRPDCWAALLQEIDDFIQLAADNDEPLFISMLAPFLRYLYCEPQRLSENALLRHGLLRVLLQRREVTRGHASVCTRVNHQLLHCLFQLFPHVLVDSITAVVEISSMAESLSSALLAEPERWRTQLAQLALQLMCVCHLSLQLGGELRSLLHTLHCLLPVCKEDLPSEQVIMGISLLLLRASASQQTALLELAVKLVPAEESPPWGASLLVMPLLQVLSCSALMEALTDPQTQAKNQDLATSLLQIIEKKTSSPVQNSTQLTLPLSTWYSELQVAASVLRQISSDSTAAMEWLYSVQSTLPPCQRVPDALPLLVTHLILSTEGDLCKLALDTAAGMAEADPTQMPGLLGNSLADEELEQFWEKERRHCVDTCRIPDGDFSNASNLCKNVPCLLPVLMFKLGRVSDMSLSHAVLFTLPKLGTHTVFGVSSLRRRSSLFSQFCIPQILHVLQMLASCSKLRAVALRLLTALWQKQDRVYPDVQRLMALVEKSSAVVGKDVQWEQILAKAACVQDICRERPYQHGGDMLAAITDTLTQCSRKDQATPATLALRGLYELCKAEVVDLGSTWKALSPKLSCETRPLVLNAVSELFSLVPSLHVKTEQYENFQSEVVSLLWSYTRSQDAAVASSGYRALAEFSESSHSIMHLPEPARPEVKQQPDQDQDEEENEKDLTVPGSSYIKLVALTPQPVLPALEVFLTALIRQEMSQMPRGVYHLALRGGNLRYDQGKTVTGVPGFMLRTYEKNKQPGLKPGLAAGLLLCYDLPVQTDKDGRPIPRFMGRKAELELMQKQGKESPEELQYKQHCAWLWVRDQLTDVVKAAAKDSPVVQGNCILALSGLAVVLSRHESSLPAQNDGQVEAGPEILPSVHWLSMVIDTLLSIVSSSSRPKAQVFPWFVHRSYSGENTASTIARSCAALGLAMLVPVLVTSHREAFPAIQDALQAGLPGAPTADDSQAVQFHSGLASGMLLAWLYQEKVSEVGGQTIWELLLSSLERLESCCFNTQLEYNGDVEQRMRVSVSLDRFLQCLQDSGNMGRMQQEVLAYSVACTGVSAFSCGIVDASKAEEVMNTLRSMTEESQQTPGLALALGLVVHGLASCGHGKAEDLHPRLLSAWTKILLAEGCPTMQRLAALNGVIALVGSETAFLQLKSESEQSPQQQNRLNEVIRSITQIISFSGTIGLQSNGAFLVAHLYLAHMSSSHSITAVPQDFSYLPEKSILRASVLYITEAGRKGPEAIRPDLIKVLLTPLATVGTSFQYPPVNWNAILSPLMRLNFGEEVQRHCVELAASQTQTSSNASLFLGVWLAPPLVHSLSERTRTLLYKCLCSWMKHIADDKLQVYVESLAVQQFHPDHRAQRLSLCLSILHGLAKAMALPNPAQNCWTILCSTTEKIYNLLPDHIQAHEVSLYEGICTCLSEMSDTEIDRIVKVTEANVEKTAFILCYLSSKGRIPLLGLNDIISTVLQKRKPEQISWLLMQCFYQSRLASNPNTGKCNISPSVPIPYIVPILFLYFITKVFIPEKSVEALIAVRLQQLNIFFPQNYRSVSKRMEWLLELMGHIRKVLYGAPTIQCVDAKEAASFLLDVFAAAVVSWADHSMPLLVGIRAQWFPWQKSVKQLDLPHELYVNTASTEESVKQCVLAMPYSLKHLLAKEPWKAQSQKFIDWLFSLTEAPEESLSQIARGMPVT